MKPTDCYYLIPCDTPPEVRATFTLCFDTDFDVDIITSRLGIVPDEARRMSLCRVNPIDGKQNPGYWEISTEKSRTWNADEHMSLLCSRIKHLLCEIVEIMKTYTGCAIFRLYVDSHQEGIFPSIVFSPEDLIFISSLNATLEVIVENIDKT